MSKTPCILLVDDNFTKFVEVVKLIEGYWLTLNAAPPLPMDEAGVYGRE